VKKIVAGCLIGLGAASLVGALDLALRVAGGPGARFLETIEYKTYDWRLTRTARPETARQDIALIEIDEYSLRNLEPNVGRWPWPRAVHGLLLDYLARAGARVIAYDVLFAGRDTQRDIKFGESTLSGEDSDRALVDSVAAAGNVLLLADATFQGEAVGGSPPLRTALAVDGPGPAIRQAIFPPFAALADAAAGFGHNLFVLDPDGPLRHTVPLVRVGDRALASLGLAAALRAGGIPGSSLQLEGSTLVVGDRRMPLSWRTVESAGGAERYLWGLIDFRGPPLLEDLKSRPYPTYSFFDLEYSEEQILAGLKPNIDPSLFRDKIVFVGVTAAGLFDVFETPFAGGRMPGIQVHAAVADDVLSGRFLREASSGADAAVLLGSALAAGLVAALVPAWWAAGGTAVLVAALGWVATTVFARGYWLNLSQPTLAACLALFGGVGYQYFVEGRARRTLKRLFGRYVSKDIYEQLVANPSLARLGGQRREMTVLFSDIRGFTTFSERGQPEEIVQMLNEYFTRMVDLVFAHHGTIDKFVGDMVMALFNAPLDDPLHPDHAVEAALDMIEALDQLNRKWTAEGREALDIGIGINTGPMIAGNIGSDAIMSYTVIGDAVNLGARLESLTKQYGTRIIISDATRRRLTGPFVVRPLGEVVVKGKSEPVSIFEVVGRGHKRDEVRA
jgi:adenylate cyclase